MAKDQQAQKSTEKKVQKVPRKHTAPVRLWAKAVFIGFRRAQRQQRENQALVQIQGVNDKQSLNYYLGKRVAFVYKVHNKVDNKKYRAQWGVIASAHGSNGLAKAQFKNNLPPRAMGARLRVMLYPNRA